MRLLNRDGKSNLHTHSIYCDGKNEPEELVQRAIALGFTELGFSGHEYAPYDLDVCMTPEGTLAYRERILALQNLYRGLINIRLGIERDFYGPGDDYPYDYVIGSVHYLKCGDDYVCVEDTPERLIAGAEKHFHGDFRALVECYYETVSHVVEKTGANIIGHFDIVTKFNEGNRFFDEESRWYRDAARSALAAAAATRPILEINTGAMAKGYRTRPYPARFLIKEADRLGLDLLLSSDCHDAGTLDYGFADLIKSI